MKMRFYSIFLCAALVILTSTQPIVSTIPVPPLTQAEKDANERKALKEQVDIYQDAKKTLEQYTTQDPKTKKSPADLDKETIKTLRDALTEEQKAREDAKEKLKSEIDREPIYLVQHALSYTVKNESNERCIPRIFGIGALLFLANFGALARELSVEKEREERNECRKRTDSLRLKVVLKKIAWNGQLFSEARFARLMLLISMGYAALVFNQEFATSYDHQLKSRALPEITNIPEGV